MKLDKILKNPPKIDYEKIAKMCNNKVEELPIFLPKINYTKWKQQIKQAVLDSVLDEKDIMMIVYDSKLYERVPKEPIYQDVCEGADLAKEIREAQVKKVEEL